MGDLRGKDRVATPDVSKFVKLTGALLIALVAGAIAFHFYEVAPAAQPGPVVSNSQLPSPT